MVKGTYMPFSKQSQFYIFSDKQIVLRIKHVEQLVITSYCRNGSLFVLANHDV